jgi:hypothetical protein
MDILRGAVLLLGAAAAGCSAAPDPLCRPEQEPSPVLLQASLDALGRYLDRFHVYADEEGTAVQARHVCSRVNSDMHASVVYDRRGGDDDLIGVELVISARLYQELPPEERAHWHSHREPAVAWTGDAEAQEALASTYGQMWYPDDADLADVDRLVARFR